MHKLIEQVKNLTNNIDFKKISIYERNSLYKINKELKNIYYNYNVVSPEINDIRNDNIIISLKIIQYELENFGKITNDVILIKNKIELEFYKIIYLCKDYLFFPKILKIQNNNVYIPVYKQFQKNLYSCRNIINILEGLRNIAKMGYSHRRLSHRNIVFDENNIPIILNYKNLTYLGEKSEKLSQDTDFFSRNTLKNNHARILDDIESLGYILIFLHTNRILNIKEKYYLVEHFDNIKNNKINQFFNLINKKIINHFEYMKIFI